MFLAVSWLRGDDRGRNPDWDLRVLESDVAVVHGTYSRRLDPGGWSEVTWLHEVLLVLLFILFIVPRLLRRRRRTRPSRPYSVGPDNFLLSRSRQKKKLTVFWKRFHWTCTHRGFVDLFLWQLCRAELSKPSSQGRAQASLFDDDVASCLVGWFKKRNRKRCSCRFRPPSGGRSRIRLRRVSSFQFSERVSAHSSRTVRKALGSPKDVFLHTNS